MGSIKSIAKKVLLVLAVSIFAVAMGTTSWADEAETKKNEGSYWSTSNAPVLYGATAITFPEGTISSFQAKDARFRMFARDFEDGDLTSKITVSGEESVDVNKEGIYYLDYSVTDSHGNTSTLRVPVTVTAATQDGTITVERTLYTLPSDWNMRLAGFTRCNTGDRQILGIYMPAGTSVQIRSLNADVNFTVQFITNDAYTEISTTVKSDGSWVTLQNTKDGTDYDSVPLITSVMQGPTNQPSPLDQLNKTYKIELKYDTSVKELNYYHYQDDEQAFRSQWKSDGNTYGVIENEVLTMVVPLADEPKMTNYYAKGFSSLDQHLEYYQKVVEQMDAYVGLSFNPENLTDQNIRTKYLVRANVHGAGAAYYAGTHVGINSASMGAFFEMNWGGLHELAHGYQGSLGKGDMGLGEVANNILGYYIQTDKSIYFHSGNWLGELSAVETNKNSSRESGAAWSDEDVSNKLYMLINLLSHFEGGDTYAKMFQWYRTQLYNGRTMTNQDAYVEALADLYGVNVIPYMEAWGLTISDELQDEIYERELETLTILKDVVSNASLKTVMSGESLTKKYSLVNNSVFEKYNITGDATVEIKIDQAELVQGKVIQVKQNGVCVRSVSIEGTTVKLENLPVGSYYLQMPIVNGYTQGHLSVQVKEGENSYTYTYTPNADEDYNNYLSLKLQGIYGTFGYVLTFKENYTKATITLGGANMGTNTNPYVKIYDADGNLVSNEGIVSGGTYFDYAKGTFELDIAPGYVIEVYHPNTARVRVYSTLSGEVLNAYNPTTNTTKYTVTENGLRTESMSEESVQELQYEVLKKQMVNIIAAYQTTATQEELENKYTNFRKKAEVLNAYEQLKEADQEPYKELIAKIQKGGSPMLTASENLSFAAGTEINLYALVSAVDNEDGVIALSGSNTTLSGNLDAATAGNYAVTYQVKDSDGNISELALTVEVLEQDEPEAETQTVHYTVQYLLQNVYDDEYTLDSERQEESEAGQSVVPQTDLYEGFILKTANFIPEENDVICVYYDRKQCVVQFDKNGADGGALPEADAYRYGTEIQLPAVDATREGYEFSGWGEQKLQPGNTYVVEKDVTFAAQWVAQPKAEEPVLDSEPTQNTVESTAPQVTVQTTEATQSVAATSSESESWPALVADTTMKSEAVVQDKTALETETAKDEAKPEESVQEPTETEVTEQSAADSEKAAKAETQTKSKKVVYILSAVSVVGLSAGALWFVPRLRRKH